MTGKIKNISHTEQGTQFQIEIDGGDRVVYVTKDKNDSQFTVEQIVTVTIT